MHTDIPLPPAPARARAKTVVIAMLAVSGTVVAYTTVIDMYFRIRSRRWFPRSPRPARRNPPLEDLPP